MLKIHFFIILGWEFQWNLPNDSKIKGKCHFKVDLFVGTLLVRVLTIKWIFNYLAFLSFYSISHLYQIIIYNFITKWRFIAKQFFIIIINVINVF